MQLASINPEILISAILGGVLPTFLWLRFWLRQCDAYEPKGLLVMSFLIGAICVPLTIPVQRLVSQFFSNPVEFIFIAAGIEEVIKFVLLRVFVLRPEFINERSDYAIYLIASALGFAALENTLYLLQPLIANNITLALTTGNLRFLGSTVVHASSSALLGLWLGLSHDEYGRLSTNFAANALVAVIAIGTATTLHGLFNYFIIKDDKLIVIATLVATWIAMLLVVTAVKQACKINPQPN